MDKEAFEEVLREGRLHRYIDAEDYTSWWKVLNNLEGRGLIKHCFESCGKYYQSNVALSFTELHKERVINEYIAEPGDYIIIYTSNHVSIRPSTCSELVKDEYDSDVRQSLIWDY